MPNETNDLSENIGEPAEVPDKQKDGPEAPKADGKGMDGQVSAEGTVDATDSSNAETAPPEDEPVGSHRSEPRSFRKMSAADFRVKSEPKQGTIPSSKPPAQEPAQPAAVQQKPEPTPEPKAPVQPIHQPTPEPAAQPKPVPPQPAPAEPKIRWEPIKEEEPAFVGYQNARYEPVQQEPEYKREEPRAHEPPRQDVAPGGIMDAIVGMISFFTIFPLNVGEKETRAMDKNFYLVPLIGLFIGIVASIIGILFYEARAAAMVPIAVLATFYIVSKFLHFDGLADFGDGMIASGDKEKCVKALKDTRIGAGGLGIALIVVLATYAGLYGMSIFPYITVLLSVVIVIMEVFAKNTMVAAAAFGEPGNGMASGQVRNTNFQSLLFSTLLSVCIAFAGYLIMGIIGSLVFHNGFLDTKPMVTAILLIIGSAASSIFIGWLVAYLSNKKFGFVNGDCLGAANEISRVLILFIALIIMGFYLYA